MIDTAAARSFWESSALSALIDYIRVPALSPAFDSEWAAHGHLDAVSEGARAWALAQGVRGLRAEVVRLPGRTPVLWLEAEGEAAGTVLMYGHLDKQPEMSGWREGLGPWLPVIEGERLYGRGGADDGYAAYAAVGALRLLQDAGGARPRCVVLIECCEESGSGDLPAYLAHLAPRIGTPDLVVCLDSGCGDYERLWCTTSLRGLASGDLAVRVLTEGVHSGDASGIVPSSFRILRQLIARIEDAESGEILVRECHAPIPDERMAQAEGAARVLGAASYDKFPLVEGLRPMGGGDADRILNRTWRPYLAVTGAEGLPPLARAGNVLRTSTTLRLSLRLPPGVDAARATERMKEILEREPPYGASVSFEPHTASPGWDAPPLAPWLGAALDRAGRRHFGPPPVSMGEGGTIPFMHLLGARYPGAQFLVTGVLGPHSNAHGPNEFLHLPTAWRVTACVADVIGEMGRR